MSASSSDANNSKEIFSVSNEKLDQPSKPMQNRKISDMKKVVGGLTKTVSNYYGENCEECENYFNVMTDEMTNEDFELAPYLLPLKNVLDQCNFMYDIRPKQNVKDSFFFLQDIYMQKFFDFYPDFIYVDMLCELPKLKLNLYLFSGIDANGSCEILALGFLKSGDGGMRWLCDTFIKHNQKSVNKIKIILSSKILRNNEVFQNAFSGKPILTSFYHFMQSLKKDISYLGFNANDKNTEQIMMIFEKMVVAPCKSIFNNLLKELKRKDKSLSENDSIVPGIKEQLILSTKFNFKLLWRSFNVFSYSIKKSLKPIICSFDTIEEVLKSCSSFIKNGRREKFKNLVSTFEKPLVNAELPDYFNYSQILTPFATKLVFQQIDNSRYMTILSPEDIVEQNFSTSVSFCTCTFCTLLSLPCNHLFGVRRSRRLCLFDESICSKKWFKANYKEVLIELFNVFFEQIAYTSFQECKNYFGISAEVGPLECPGIESVQRFIILQYLVHSWDRELKVNIWEPPSARMSTDSCYLITVLKSYRACSSLTIQTFEELHGISLNDILHYDDDTI